MQLTSGKAEMFGTELAPDKPYTFYPGAKVAVYTWHGCTLKLTRNTEGTYITKETPMVGVPFHFIKVHLMCCVILITRVTWYKKQQRSAANHHQS